MAIPAIPVTAYSEQERLRLDNAALKREIDAKRIRLGLDPKYTETK